MSVERNTPTFDALQRLVGRLGGEYELRAVGLSPKSSDKLAGLIDSGRELTAVTPSVKRAVVAELQKAASQVITSGGSIRVERALDKAAAKAGEFVVLRLVQQRGFGAPFRPLAASTIARKRADKRPAVRANATRIGVATGELLEDLEAARWVFEKVG